MGSPRPWTPASQRDAIEVVVQSEVLPELIERLARKQQAREAAQRQAASKASSLRQLRAMFKLPERSEDRTAHWQREDKIAHPRTTMGTML
jgi:hypothetical protein